jgi:hypothetical protein
MRRFLRAVNVRLSTKRPLDCVDELAQIQAWLLAHDVNRLLGKITEEKPA